MTETVSLRRRNRLAAMRSVQAIAVAMFESGGFEATAVEGVADASGVSTSTIYRYFGTKEMLVLWDERSEVVETELATRLATQSPVEAFRDAMVVAFGARQDRDLFLRRLQLVYREQAIWGAAAQRDRVDRSDLAAGIAAIDGRSAATWHDTLTAAVCLTALDVAFEQWQGDPSGADLADVIRDAVNTATRGLRV